MGHGLRDLRLGGDRSTRPYRLGAGLHGTRRRRRRDSCRWRIARGLRLHAGDGDVNELIQCATDRLAYRIRSPLEDTRRHRGRRVAIGWQHRSSATSFSRDVRSRLPWPRFWWPSGKMAINKINADYCSPMCRGEWQVAMIDDSTRQDDEGQRGDAMKGKPTTAW